MQAKARLDINSCFATHYFATLFPFQMLMQKHVIANKIFRKVVPLVDYMRIFVDLDPISKSYVCMWNHMQRDQKIKHLTHVGTRAKCARACYNNAECIGFEYYPAGNKDCYLSKTPWQTMQPVATGGRWSCEHKGG